MKLIRFDGGRIGVTDGNKVADVTRYCGTSEEWPPVAMNRLIRDFEVLREELKKALEEQGNIDFSQVRLETPVPWPNKLLAFPVNYHDHATEMASTGLANIQGFFLKANSSLSGAGEPIELPDLPGRPVHHECELGVVIGKAGRQIPVEHALEHVFGYACLIDVTVRGREERVMRKSYDTFTPVGPWIVTADEIGDPGALDMKLWVGDELRQHANTRDLIVSLPEMIAVASSAATLHPGDIIATGTPAGVGPIEDGDSVRIAIERVGEMTVRVVRGALGRNVVFEKPYEFKRAGTQGGQS
mgnify:CR=1 FL=1